MFIFLWTVFVTAVILLLIAISATYRQHASRAEVPPMSFAERYGKPSFRAVKWGDEEMGDVVVRIGVEGVDGFNAGRGD